MPKNVGICYSKNKKIKRFVIDILYMESYAFSIDKFQSACPVFIAADANDGLVPAIQSIKMAEALNNAGVSYELHLFELGDHGFALGRYIPEPYREDKKHADSKWVEMAKKFLMHQVAEETTHFEKHPFGDFI